MAKVDADQDGIPDVLQGGARKTRSKQVSVSLSMVSLVTPIILIVWLVVIILRHLRA